MKNVLILMFSEVAVKVMGLIYKLVITNIEGFGDTGLGYYASGYQIYSLPIKKRRKMNFNVTFTEDALTVAWKSTGSVAICKSTKTAGGMCASIFVLMLCRLSRSFRLH